MNGKTLLIALGLSGSGCHGELVGAQAAERVDAAGHGVWRLPGIEGRETRSRGSLAERIGRSAGGADCWGSGEAAQGFGVRRLGDTANKIGTYQMAVLAKENNVPFYIAAPISTLDLAIPDGGHIPIEERSAAEVTHVQGVRIAPDVPAAHPAFDVTPSRYIRAIFTERGVATAPYAASLRKLTAAPVVSVAR